MNRLLPDRVGSGLLDALYNKIHVVGGRAKRPPEVEVGDRLYAFDGERVTATRVIRVFSYDVDEYLHIALDVYGAEKRLLVTPDSSLCVCGEGWSCAGTLREGNSLLCTLCIPPDPSFPIRRPRSLIEKYGTRVMSVVRIRKRARVYSFECVPHENYFVNYVLLHSCRVKNVKVLLNAVKL